ncbi:GA module-containing protein [Mycoplasmopsis bovigenitalium]|nr:GA module-containing protein [Mycoplasmopsis bovigenitalium]
MGKKTRNTLLGLAAILTICGTTSATLSTVISSKKHISEQKIVEQIDKLIEQINNDIQTLESNKNSVDTLKKAIDKSKKSLEKYKQKFNEWSKNEYKQYKNIQQPLANFDSSIKDLENKIKESEEKLKQNIQTVQNIVDNAKKTSDEAIEKLEKTSETNLPGLKQANQELQNAAKELEKAKQTAQEMNSQSHVDDLVLKAKEVQKAEEKVKKLINTIQNQTDKQRYDSYQDELNKHINILNKNIEESNNLNDDLSILEPFIEKFEKDNFKAEDAHNFINSIKEPLPQEITNTNRKLKDVIENSEQKINELKSNISNIKSKIDNELNLLNQSQNESKSKIDSTNDINVLTDEFNKSNQRLKVEIPKLNDKIDKYKYQEASPKVIELIENEKSLANAILQKLKNDALNHLNSATNLSDQQNEAFKNQIENATTPQQISKIKNDISLANFKEKAKNDINELQNINSEKQNFINKIDLANNKEEINNIVQEANELNESNSNSSNTSNVIYNTSSTQPTVNLHSKQIAKEKIDKLEYLSEDEKQDFKTNIDNSNDDQEIENHVSNAQTNNQNKQNIVENVKDLDLISTNRKTSAEEYIKNNSLEDSNIKHEELSATNDEKLKIRKQINNAQIVGDIDRDTKRELLNKLINNDDQATLQEIKDILSKHQAYNNELIKAIADFKKLLDKFIKINEKVTISELKNQNQTIINNLDRNIKDYEQKLEKGINSKWLVSEYAAKVNTANKNTSYYINNLEKAIEFIDKRSRNQSINDRYLEEYHKAILENYETEIKCISTRNFEDFRIFAQSLSKLENINSSPIKTIAKELFKNEIILLVGNGIWSISSETVPYNSRSGYKTKVAKIYFEQNSSASNPKIMIDESYYREIYKNFEIKWYGNPDWHKSTAIKKDNGYDYLSDGLIFDSNDEFGTKFKIWIKGNDALYIENIPSKEEYMSKHSASEIQKDSDVSHHIKPEHLEFIDY